MKIGNIPELLLDPLLRSLTPESASDNDKVWLVVVVLVELLCAESGLFPGDFSFDAISLARLGASHNARFRAGFGVVTNGRG